AAGSQTLSSELVEKATQRLEIQSKFGPKVIPISGPLGASVPSKPPEVVPPATAAPQLTYQPRSTRQLPGWGIWVGVLIAALFSAGFALPSNAVKGIERKVREEMTATRNLTSSVGNSPGTRLAVDSEKSGRGA